MSLPAPYYQDKWATVLNLDCKEFLRAAPECFRVDHVITDPPYTQKTSENMRSRKDISDGGAYITNGNGRRRIDFDGVDGQEIELANLFLKVAGRWVLVFCALEQIGEYSKVGKQFIRGTAWHRTNPAPQFTGDRPGQVHEGAVILHNAGKKIWNRGGNGLAWIGPTVNSCGDQDRGNGHPTAKPTWIMADAIDALTLPGETILDPFMGSGTTLVAAKRLGRKSIGIEIEEKYCAIAARRLEAENTLFDLAESKIVQPDLLPE